VIVLDGATGTELGRRGVETRSKLFSAAALLDEKGRRTLLQIHRDYLKAGAQVITANTFRTNPRTAGPRWRELTELAVHIAKESGARAVAGSLAPVADCYLPELRPPPEVARRDPSRRLLRDHTGSHRGARGHFTGARRSVFTLRED
jgi:S-methylmethionine-dependent homocysteine/selenocysteine methylase